MNPITTEERITALIETLREPWRADFSLQPKTASERFDVIYIQELKRQAAEVIEELQVALMIEKKNKTYECVSVMYSGGGSGEKS